MTPETSIALLVSGKPLAARVAARHTESQAWLAVYPSHAATHHHAPTILNAPVPESIPFLVRVFEIRDSLLTSERWLCEADILRIHDVRVEGVAALGEVLGSFGLSIEALVQPWMVDFPL